MALGYFTSAQNTLHRLQCLRVLGDISSLKGERALASRHYREALRLAKKAGATREVARIRDCLELATA